VQNVFEDRIDVSDVMEMNFSEEDYQKYKLQTGDILLNEGQSLELVGRAAIYRGELPGACFTSTLVRYRPYPPIDPEFPLLIFRYFLRSGRFQRIASTTTNIAHLGARRFARLAFPLPPIEEQRHAVGRARPALNMLDRLEETLAQADGDIGVLEATALQNAHSGQLVPTEAEIRGDDDSIRNEITQVLAAVRAERRQPIRKRTTVPVSPRVTTRKSPPERRSLLVVLSEAGEPLAPDQLLARAGYDHESIEEFYLELRDAVTQGRVVEVRPNEADVALRLGPS